MIGVELYEVNLSGSNMNDEGFRKYVCTLQE